jgi:hypothetical protein
MGREPAIIHSAGKLRSAGELSEENLLCDLQYEARELQITIVDSGRCDRGRRTECFVKSPGHWAVDANSENTVPRTAANPG